MKPGTIFKYSDLGLEALRPHNPHVRFLLLGTPGNSLRVLPLSRLTFRRRSRPAGSPVITASSYHRSFLEPMPKSKPQYFCDYTHEEWLAIAEQHPVIKSLITDRLSKST